VALAGEEELAEEELPEEELPEELPELLPVELLGIKFTPMYNVCTNDNHHLLIYLL
jgi:hypothetical protein